MREPLIPTKNPTELVTRLELNDALTGRNIVFEFIFDSNAARDAFFSVPANLPALSTAVLVTEGPWIQIYTRATGQYDPAGWNDISPTFITNFDVVYFTSSNVPAAPYSLRVLYVNTTTGVLAVASQDGTQLVYQTPPDIESFNALRNFPSGSTISFHGEDGGVPYLGLLVTDNPDAQEIDGAKVDPTHNALYFQMALDGLTIGATQGDGATQYVKFPVVGDSTINGKRILTEDDLSGMGTGGGFDVTDNADEGTVITRAVQNPPYGPYIGLCATEKPDAASISEAYAAGKQTVLHEVTVDHSFISATDAAGSSTGVNVLSDHVEIYNNDAGGARLQTVLFPVTGRSTINGHDIVTEDMLPDAPSIVPADLVSGDPGNTLTTGSDDKLIVPPVDVSELVPVPGTVTSADLSIGGDEYSPPMAQPQPGTFHSQREWNMAMAPALTTALAEIHDLRSFPRISVQAFPYTDDNWDGTLNAFEAALNDYTSIVSFWGDFTELQAVNAGDSTQILSPAQYPLLSRFVGQVDQWAQGYNANIGNFAYMPIRITAAQGFEIVAAPNVAVGTNFSFQFMLVLSSEASSRSVTCLQSAVNPQYDIAGYQS
jgi:hypothetical protein